MRNCVIGTGRAHGKVILLGEHSVVYGRPAIALPLPALTVEAAATSRDDPDSLDTSVSTAADTASMCGNRYHLCAGDTLGSTCPDSGPRIAVEEALGAWGLAGAVVDLVIGSAIPPGCGLGSSAACTCAAVRAVADLHSVVVDPESLYRFVQSGESFTHGRASGVDARAVTASGPIWFQAGVIRPMDIGLEAALVVADTGTVGNTQQAVAVVRAKLDRDPISTRRLLAQAAAVTSAAADDLGVGRVKALGRKLTTFQALLGELGVSTPEIDRLISAAVDAGALGAKLTGGGLGGCVVALADGSSRAATISQALLETGAAQTWTVAIRNSPR
ncbi:mevalonate kinase [Nocardia terpenica]|uniref:mevalonate kinase n=1 Tax=Nocardia terpenica TaxID=455432 RepID=A0A6G9ZF18_9NOCA|nr:mevalonate kinase [Nocardia terpenica]QIS23583.1 mevalonate kinase [Nocardia terpenica]